MVTEILFHTLATINHHRIYWINNHRRHHRRRRPSYRIIDHFINATTAIWAIAPMSHHTEIPSICRRRVGDVFGRTITEIIRIRCDRHMIHITFPCIVWIILVHHRHHHHIHIGMISGDSGSWEVNDRFWNGIDLTSSV